MISTDTSNKVWTCDYRGWIMLLNVHQILTSANKTTTTDDNQIMFYLSNR